MKVRRIGIATKIFMAIIALLIVSDAVIGVTMYQRAKKLLVTQIKENAMNISRCVAASVDGELLDEIHEGDENSEAYTAVLDELSLFLENSGVEYVYTIRKGAGGNAEFVVDSDPEEPGLPGEDFGDSSQELERAFAGETTVNEEPYTDEWGTHISAFSPILAGNQVAGLAVIDLSVEWVNLQTRNIASLIIVICTVVLAIGILILLVIRHFLRSGFAALNDKVVELARGDGDLTKQIELHSGDEFEVIGDNINRFLQYIRTILLNISKDSDSLQSAAKNIAQNMQKSQDDAGDVSATMQQLSASMEETSASLNRIYELMNQITDAFQGIDSKIHGGSDFSHTMKRDAENVGQKAVDEQSEALKRVERMKSAVQARIESSREVEQISRLTEDILKITQQTNLLALNASIEAARAGEAGRGFAVVASEIGQLAQDSANSASEIQSVSAVVISAVDALAKESQGMIDFINETAMKGYDDLVTTSGEYRTSAEQIDGIMQECAQISARIRNNIEEIREYTNSVNTAVEEAARGVTMATERTVDMSEHLAYIGNEAESSKNMTDELFGEVNHFKV